jgi:hypothetical protein
MPIGRWSNEAAGPASSTPRLRTPVSPHHIALVVRDAPAGRDRSVQGLGRGTLHPRMARLLMVASRPYLRRYRKRVAAVMSQWVGPGRRSPESSPARNQRTRCPEEPWVKDSGETWPRDCAGCGRRRWRPPPRPRIPRPLARAGSASGRGHPAVLDRARDATGVFAARAEGAIPPGRTAGPRPLVRGHAVAQFRRRLVRIRRLAEADACAARVRKSLARLARSPRSSLARAQSWHWTKVH